MRCQRVQGPERGPAAAQIRLTDQALVAVALSREAASPGRATAAHLLVGLACEPDGVAAGAGLGLDPGAIRLAERLPATSGSLPSVETVLGWAAGAVTHRPLWTSDLLDAAIEVGGGDLADVCEACGLQPTRRATRAPDDATVAEALDGEALVETFGLDPRGQGGSRLSPAAGRAVARTRALGGGAVLLVVALAVEAETAPEDVPAPPRALRRRLRADRPLATLALTRPDEDDRGLDAVLAAAARIAEPDAPVAAIDLLRAAVLAGGRLPAALLALDEDD